MKILLVNPPMPKYWYNDEYYFPSSMLYLASALRDARYDVKIFDMKTVKPDNPSKRSEYYETVLLEKIREFEPDLIGFGSLFSGNFPDALHYSKVSKANFPDIPIVAGGIHFTIYAEKILEKCPSFDWIVLGEGENTIVDLVKILEKGENDFSDIDGFAYRKDNQVIINPKLKFIKDADAISFPAYELINFEDYYTDTSHWHNPKKLPIKTSVPIISSRSCPNRCSFCSMFRAMGPHWRPRSAKNVVDEIEYVYNKYNHRHFSFMDDNMTLNKKRTLEICNEINNRGLNIQFETPNGLNINTLDPKVIEALVSAGLVRVSLAIESGSDYMRNTVMHKNLKREKIFEVLDILKSYPQVHVSAFFIIGMPEETHETLNDTYQMIEKINADKIQLMNIVPFMGTPVFSQALKDGLLVDIDPNKIYEADDLYFKNIDKYFIKPYDISLNDLREFRKKCDKLIESQQNEMIKQ